jgi:hypothetical protein
MPDIGARAQEISGYYGRNEFLPVNRGFLVVRDLALTAYASRTPAAIFVPRRNSSADIGCLPARCTCVSRTAPAPQAMVR